MKLKPLVVLNKMDLSSKSDVAQLEEKFPQTKMILKSSIYPQLKQ